MGFVYDLARQSFLNGAINWTNDTIKAILVSNAYTPNAATHQYLSSIPAAQRLSTSVALTAKTSAAGVAGADNTIFPAVTAGNTGNAIVIIKDTGTDTTSPLIAYIDSAASGLPVTTNGGDVNCGWDTGANRIFKL